LKVGGGMLFNDIFSMTFFNGNRALAVAPLPFGNDMEKPP
jgi:hypothetical protein